MAIDPRHRENLEAHLFDVAEAEGLEKDERTFVELLFREWETVTDAAALERDRKADTRAIKELEAEKIRNATAATEIQRRLDELNNPRVR